jgi:hypothetical protein
MKIPVETKPVVWGIAGGAVLAAIVGFTWGGWVTGGKAEADAAQRASAAVVVALAPVCVERFQRAPEVAANLAALKKVDSWSQGDFVEKGGWATGARIEGVRPSVGSVQSMCITARRRVTDCDGIELRRRIFVKLDPSKPAVFEKDPLTVDVPREFHRRMAAIH